MKRITRVLFSFLWLLSSSLTIIAMDDNEKEVPLLKTLAAQQLSSNMRNQIFSADFKTFTIVSKLDSQDIKDLVFSQEFSFPSKLFSDSIIYSDSEIRLFGAYLTNIKMSNIGLNDCLIRQRVAPRVLRTLLHSTALTSLDLSWNDLRQDICDYLIPLSGLVKLDLAGNSLRSFNLETFPNLTYLNLASGGLCSFNLGTFPNLTYLNLRRNMLQRIPSYESQYYPKPDIKFCLKTLDVSENLGMYISNNNVEYCTALTNLNLHSCRLYSINDLSIFTNLQTLNVANNNLMGSFGVFPILTNLTNLNVAYQNGTTAADFSALKSLVDIGKVTVYLGKRPDGTPVIKGPHPELFDTNTP